MQRSVLECIRDFIKKHHYPPTIPEISRILGLRSKGTVSVHLRALRDQGLLTWQPACERTFVVTDKAWVALEVLNAFLESKGVPDERRLTRRFLMRNVLRRPEVCAAISDLLASRGFRLRDAVALHAAYINGEVEVVRFTRDGKYTKLKLPPNYTALQDYWRLIGFL